MPTMQALQAMRGVQLIAAMTLVAELQDFLRFESPRQLMAYLGLVPTEYSSGPKCRQGAITKAGNSAARRMLVEVALPLDREKPSQRTSSPALAGRRRKLGLW
ncbi:transposase [Roseateles sp.]|uniref:transposase n=1 Tax=Roseateles sp. TaxID=1971397 RepID=UPI003D0D2E8E